MFCYIVACNFQRFGTADIIPMRIGRHHVASYVSLTTNTYIRRRNRKYAVTCRLSSIFGKVGQNRRVDDVYALEGHRHIVRRRDISLRTTFDNMSGLIGMCPSAKTERPVFE